MPPKKKQSKKSVMHKIGQTISDKFMALRGINNYDNSNMCVVDEYADDAYIDNQLINILYRTEINDQEITNKLKTKLDEVGMPKGFEAHSYTYLPDAENRLDYLHFKAGIIINREKKTACVVIPGTELKSKKILSDLINDGKIAIQETPAEKAIDGLNNQLLTILGDECKDYKVHYTGHSLGATLADCAAVDFLIRMKRHDANYAHKNPNGQPKISTITFENPGSKPIVKKMYQEHADLNIKINDISHTNFINSINPINMTNRQVGTTFNIGKANGVNFLAIAAVSAIFVVSLTCGIPPVAACIGLAITATYGLLELRRVLKNHKLINFEIFLNDTKKVKETHTRENIFDTSNTRYKKRVEDLQTEMYDLQEKYKEVKSVDKEEPHESIPQTFIEKVADAIHVHNVQYDKTCFNILKTIRTTAPQDGTNQVEYTMLNPDTGELVMFNDADVKMAAEVMCEISSQDKAKTLLENIKNRKSPSREKSVDETKAIAKEFAEQASQAKTHNEKEQVADSCVDLLAHRFKGHVEAASITPNSKEKNINEQKNTIKQKITHNQDNVEHIRQFVAEVEKSPHKKSKLNIKDMIGNTLKNIKHKIIPHRAQAQ